jgi:hypothetical protein
MTPSSVLSAKACNIGSGRARYDQLFKLFRGTKPPFSSVLSRARRSGFPGTRFISVACTTEPTCYKVPPSLRSEVGGVGAGLGDRS